MTTLQLVFHCMCLYVRDDAGKTVYVLMPSMAGHEPKHYAELRHSSFAGPWNTRSIEGWALVLGPQVGIASARPQTLEPHQQNEILDLTAATAVGGGAGLRVRRELVTDASPALVARVTLRAGEVTDTEAETSWKFDGRVVDMVSHVVWEMEIDDVADPLDWRSIGAEGDPPLASLAELGAEEPLQNVPGRPTGRMGYRLEVYHSTRTDLRPQDVAHHFRAFYEQLLDGHEPTPDQLPYNKQEGPKVYCGGAQARLA